MDFYRLKHTIGMYLTLTATKRAEYIKNHNVFNHMGDKCMIMFRKIPLYPELISFGNNVHIASNTIVGVGCLVNKDIRHGGVYAGTPIQYICSLEEYCKKRGQYPEIVIIKKARRLSEDTLKTCRERFESHDL